MAAVLSLEERLAHGCPYPRGRLRRREGAMRFDEIPPAGVQFQYDDVRWLPGPAMPPVRRGSGAIRLDRQGERVLCQGSLEVEVELVCDRCLAAYTTQLTASFRFFLQVAAPEGPREYTCRRSDLDVIELPAPEVDLREILRQQFLLVQPVKCLCSPDCRGLCPQCGADRNQGDCGCRSGKSSPFAVLAGLRDGAPAGGEEDQARPAAGRKKKRNKR